MKKVIILSLILVFVMSNIVFAGTGFNENNKNETARLYQGFYYENVHLIMKWSKDWTPMAQEPEGAWLSNIWTWYSDEYGEDTYYGMDLPNVYGTGKYRVEEVIKMKACDPQDVQALMSQGSTLIWGNIVVLMDRITVYDNVTGEIVTIIDYSEMAHPGYGNLKF